MVAGRPRAWGQCPSPRGFSGGRLSTLSPRTLPRPALARTQAWRGPPPPGLPLSPCQRHRAGGRTGGGTDAHTERGCILGEPPPAVHTLGPSWASRHRVLPRIVQRAKALGSVASNRSAQGRLFTHQGWTSPSAGGTSTPSPHRATRVHTAPAQLCRRWATSVGVLDHRVAGVTRAPRGGECGCTHIAVAFQR